MHPPGPGERPGPGPSPARAITDFGGARRPAQTAGFNPQTPSLVRPPHVLSEHVRAEVVGRVAPHSVNVVCLVLHVVVLH